MNISCANPNGNVTITLSPGSENITLLDNGQGFDQGAGDGIYSAQWTPTTEGIFTLTFRGGDEVTVITASPLISVTPTSLDFGGVGVGSSADRNLTVTNAGGGVLSGNATTSAPYSIASGGSYSLNPGQSQTVTVRFAPTGLGTFLGNVNFTGGGGVSVTVSGAAAEVNSITPNPVDLAAPPANLSITGNGFADFGFGLSVANFYNSGGTLIAQARASSGTSTDIVVSFPTTEGPFGPLPGLSAGPVTVEVYNQLGSNSWSLVGSISLTVNNTRGTVARQ